MSDLSLTRIFASEHSYPTPTRNHLSMHNREASKRAMYGATKASKVRFGKRLPDGTTIMGAAPLTQTEAQIRAEELANIRMDASLRAERIRATLSKQAEALQTDSWAHKV